MTVPEPARKLLTLAWTLLAFLGSALCEKDRHKTAHMPTALVLSTSRVVVLALTIVWIRTVWVSPELLARWPVATTGVFLAVALPVVGALKTTDPEKVLQWARGVADRLGQGN